MSGSSTTIDWTTISQIGTVGVVVAGIWRASVKLDRWRQTTDQHLKDQDKQITDIKTEVVKVDEKLDRRLEVIEKELKPNGGGSHHDVLVNEIRRAVDEITGDDTRRDKRRRFR